MQTFWRSARGFGNHLSRFKVAPEVFQFNFKLTTLKLNLVTCESRTCSQRNYTTAFPSNIHLMNFSITKGSRLHQGELLQANSSIVLPSHSKYVSLRSMTTPSSSYPVTDVRKPEQIKFKRLDKTAKHIMNILDKEAVDKVKSERDIPDLKPGCIVQLKVEVPENKRRLSVLKGIIIARRNAGLNSTFRLRRLVDGVGVESVFPLYCPNIKEITVLDQKKVKRAKLYHLRDRMNPLKK